MIEMAKALGELALVVSLLTCACARTEARDTPLSAAGSPGVATSVSLAPLNTAAVLPAPSVVVPVVEGGPPRQVVRGDGISITEASNGEVILKSTSLWNEAIETTYASCDYFRGAVPVLKRQLRDDRGKLLTTICTAKK